MGQPIDQEALHSILLNEEQVKRTNLRVASASASSGGGSGGGGSFDPSLPAPPQAVLLQASSVMDTRNTDTMDTSGDGSGSGGGGGGGGLNDGNNGTSNDITLDELQSQTNDQNEMEVVQE